MGKFKSINLPGKSSNWKVKVILQISSAKNGSLGQCVVVVVLVVVVSVVVVVDWFTVEHIYGWSSSSDFSASRNEMLQIFNGAIPECLDRTCICIVVALLHISVMIWISWLRISAFPPHILLLYCIHCYSTHLFILMLNVFSSAICDIREHYSSLFNTCNTHVRTNIWLYIPMLFTRILHYDGLQTWVICRGLLVQRRSN